MYSIIIPAYNEERRINTTLLDYYEYFKSKKEPFEIIVVFDGKDDTGKIVKAISKDRKNISLLSFSSRLGKGGAILEGFKLSKGDVVGFTDADNSVRPEDFYRLLEKAVYNDCCIASRRITGARLSKAPITRRLLSILFNLYVNSIFFLGIKDTQCGSKAFKNELIINVLNEIKTRGFEFDAELLWRIKNHGYHIYQIPVDWRHADYSSVRMANTIKMFFNLLSVRLGARREMR